MAPAQYGNRQFAASGTILAVIAGCFPAVIQPTLVVKSQSFRGQSPSSRCFFAAFISDISKRRETTARRLTARCP
jgi:hypothetical protein